MMTGLLRNVRFAVRRLLKTPTFTIIAVLVIALGIGMNTATFSVIEGVVLRPLPYAGAERLVVVSGSHPQIGRFSASYPDFADLKSQSQSFEYFGAYYQKGFTLTGHNEPHRVQGYYVSADFFPMLGASPALGRFFLPSEEMSQGAPAVVLSHALWRDRFGSDASIVGRHLTLDSEVYTVAGVSPPDFQPPFSSQLWVPLTMPEEDRGDRSTRFLGMLAKLKPGVGVGQAQAELDTIARRLEEQYPGTNAGRRAALTSLHEELTGEDKQPLLMTFAAVAFVLLIACFNLANLFMARAISRVKQTGILLALGASRAQVAAQFLIESMVLALSGGALGIFFSLWARDLIVSWLAIGPQMKIETAPRVMLFALGASLLTGLIAGLVPALRISKIDPLGLIKEGGNSGSTGGRNSLLKALVSAEVGLALALVVGALLMLKSLSLLQKVDLGFDPNDLLTVSVSIPEKKYKTPEQQAAFFTQMLQQIAAVPGMTSASLVSIIPMGSSFQATKFSVEGRPAPTGSQINRARYHVVSPPYFETMKIPLASGRGFTEQDRDGSQKVVIVSRKMAEQYWPNEDPVGRRISLEDAPQTWLTVVGVAGDVKYGGLTAEPGAQFYLPFLQSPQPSMSVVLRGPHPTALAKPVRNAVWAVDSTQPVERVRTMEQIINDRLGRTRSLTNIISIFGLMALLLAGLGIYGVTAYSVRQRTREIGIRMALGAKQSHVVLLIVRQSLFFILIGVAAGLAGALGFMRVISALLYGVQPTDPASLALSAAVLVAVGMVASYFPARKASRVDPVMALRQE
jgi:putative ABC transport system permease protein